MVIALLTALWVGAASAQVPRQVGLGEVRVEDDRRIVALTIDEVEGVLAVDINVVLDSRAVTVLDFALTDLLPGFFAFHNVDSDTLKFAAASAQSVRESTAIFIVGIVSTPACVCSRRATAARRCASNR